MFTLLCKQFLVTMKQNYTKIASYGTLYMYIQVTQHLKLLGKLTSSHVGLQ